MIIPRINRVTLYKTIELLYSYSNKLKKYLTVLKFIITLTKHLFIVNRVHPSKKQVTTRRNFIKKTNI